MIQIQKRRSHHHETYRETDTEPDEAPILDTAELDADVAGLLERISRALGETAVAGE